MESPERVRATMIGLFRGCLIGALCCASAGLAAGQGPKGLPQTKEPVKKEPASKEPVKKEPVKKSADPKDSQVEPPKKMDKSDAAARMKFPPGAIVVLVDELKDILAAVPKMIFIRMEEYQAMQEEIRALKAKLKNEKLLPFACKLSGRVDGDFVLLQADFTFETDEAKRTLILGLQGAHLLEEGNLDGQSPHLDFGPDGFTARVEKAGKHHLTLKLKLPVSLKRTGTPGSGTERGFELGLPGSAVTLLALEVPASVQELRWNDQPGQKWKPGSPKGKWDITLGKIKSLSLSWKEPVSLPGTGPLLSADGKIIVRVEDNQALTRAEISLVDLRGQVREFALHLPPQAKVEVKSPTGMLKEIHPPDEKKPFHLLQLNEPTFEPIIVEVLVQQPWPPAGQRLAIGPFFLVNAYKQQGTILVRAQQEALRGMRWTFQRHGDVFQREVPGSLSGPDVLGYFEYLDMLAPAAAAKSPDKMGAATPLVLRLSEDKAQLETTTEHSIQVSRLAGAFQAEITTRIKVKSLSPGVDFIDVQLPRPRVDGLAQLGIAAAGWPANIPWSAMVLAAQKNWPAAAAGDFLIQGEGGLLTEMQPADSNRRARITLSRTEAREFTVVLTGRYVLPAYPLRAVVDMPRPIGLLDRGGKITIVGKNDVEIMPPGQEGAVASPDRKPQAQLLDKAPARIDMAWRLRPAEFPVRGVVDIVIHGKQARVQQHLHFAGSDRKDRDDKTSRDAVLLRLPPQVKAFRVEPPSRLAAHYPEKGQAWIRPPADARQSEPVLLDYDFTLPAHTLDKGVTVPLVWPEPTTRLDVKVRIWSDAGMVPVLAAAIADHWRVRGTERGNNDVMPALVLRATGGVEPLILHLYESPAPLPDAIFDRGLVQIAIGEDGGHSYRVRFLVRKLNTDRLEIRLPAGGTLQSASYGGDKLTNWSPAPDDKNLLRLPLHATANGRPTVLDLEFKLTPSASGLAWHESLRPPSFVNDIHFGPLRWHVWTPVDWIAFAGGANVQLDYHWVVENGVFTPEASLSADDLERWLTGGAVAPTGTAGGMVFWRSSLEPLSLWHFPRRAWLLLCSGALLAVGLGLCVLLPGANRVSLGILMLLVAAGGLATALFWPALLPWLVYGCQPGFAVLLIVLGVQWLLQERYRRQVVFMPGFTRLGSNSSLVRAGNRPQASTVDAPPSASSQPAQPSRGSSQLNAGVSQGS
ncbi:MAG: MFS transporter [Planctomycetes bacterium]|nr:MFS transporter [Planctomycetota bacterium]